MTCFLWAADFQSRLISSDMAMYTKENSSTDPISLNTWLTPYHNTEAWQLKCMAIFSELITEGLIDNAENQPLLSILAFVKDF